MTKRAVFVALALGAAAAMGVAGQERPRVEPVRPRGIARPAPPLDRIEPSAEQRRLLATPARGTRADVSPALDDFPYQAQDFAADERVFNGKKVHNPDNPTSTWQQFAYDIGASKLQANGTWSDFKPTTDWKNPKNSDYYIYGKSVYAVSDGVIVNCWRNAPENPRPASSELDNVTKDTPLADVTFLHPDTRAGKVHGSGNFVMIREANGNHVHYAHAQPGSIPAKLCPHEGVLLSPETWNADSTVPPSQQVQVKRGDFLFRTGNSGTSSAPHLHIDRTQANKATSVQLRFRNGLANPLAGGKLQNAEWESFAGQQIPPGPVLVWPPRRAGGLWSWHGQDGKTWGEHFRHMADSGYQMTWIDGYSVAGKPYFNTIWRPATAPWLGYALLSGADYQEAFDKAAADGFAPVHVDSVLAGGQPRYNAVFVKGAPKDIVARHGQTAAQFDATFEDLTGKGYVAANASVVSVNGQLRYTSLFRKQNLGGWVLLPGIAKGDYQKVYDENAALGRRPFYVNSYKHGNGVFYSVVFAQQPNGPRKDRHGLSPAAYQQEFGNAGNLAIQAVTGVDGAAANHEYAAIWRQGP